LISSHIQSQTQNQNQNQTIPLHEGKLVRTQTQRIVKIFEENNYCIEKSLPQILTSNEIVIIPASYTCGIGIYALSGSEGSKMIHSAEW
jgi:CMP-N-acetylneuraminic acid synthetase